MRSEAQRGHEDQSVHEARSAECTDVSEWPLSASDLTMHATSCLNPIMTWFHATSIAKWRKMRRHWRVSLGERICTSSSTTPASCRYSHWHPPYVTIKHSMRGSRRDTLIFIGGKSQHETTVETQTEKKILTLTHITITKLNAAVNSYN